MKFINFLFLIATLTLTGCAQTTKEATTNSAKEENITNIKQVNATKLKSIIEKEQVQLIDVRTPKEYKVGRIDYAKNINVFDKNFIAQTTSLNKEKPVYLYCKSGRRSMSAANKLKKEGFNVINLTGGIKEWQGNKFEVKK